MGDVWSELIGQERAVGTLRRAVEGHSHAMTHAWLFVGPPGSGRSNAAKASWVRAMKRAIACIVRALCLLRV